MNKKLRKTRVGRTNTLEAMACACGCNCDCDCTTCSGGGSFKETERVNRRKINRDKASTPARNAAIKVG